MPTDGIVARSSAKRKSSPRREPPPAPGFEEQFEYPPATVTNTYHNSFYATYSPNPSPALAPSYRYAVVGDLRDWHHHQFENGGRIEHAQQIADHESPRTTKLYDRTSDAISLDEIERILI
jgi:hypothetical protein